MKFRKTESHRSDSDRCPNSDNDPSQVPSSSLEAERIVPLYKRLGAELIGTFDLVFASVGSDISNSLAGNEFGKFAVAAVPGLVIIVMIYGLDKISGAYFNPAVSIGFTITKHLKQKDLLMYIAVQIVGPIIASLVVMAVIGKSGNVGLTLPNGSDHWYHAFILEVVLTFLLMLVSISM